MILDPVKNFAKCVVSIGYDADDTIIVLNSEQGAKLPNPVVDGAFNLVWWNSTDYSDPSDDPNVEIVRCTVRSTNTLTIIRAQEGTLASTKNISNKVYLIALVLTKKMLTDIANESDPVYSVAPASGISSGNIANWDIAYGWGDHALAGYLTEKQFIYDEDYKCYVG